MPDYIYEKLKTSAQTQNLIEIYDSVGDDDSFQVGTILWVSENLLAIRNLDKFGRPNGIAIFDIESIPRFGFESTYLKRIASDMLHHPPREIPDVPMFADIEEAIEFFHKTKTPISIYDATDNSDTGIVLETGQDGFLFGIYFLGADWDGNVAIKLDSIIRIDAYGNYEMNLAQNL